MFSMPQFCRTRALGAILGFALLGSMSACDDTESDATSRSPTSDRTDGSATLIVWSDGGRVDMPSDGARITGTLGLSAQGCVVLDDIHVLIAPPGSSVDAEGTRVTIAGLGELEMGEAITGHGGYVTEPVDDWVPDPGSCMPLPEGGEFVVFSAD